MPEPEHGDTFLCLACGHQYEGKREESGEDPAVTPRCPACRSVHVLNLTRGTGSGGCGTADDLTCGCG